MGISFVIIMSHTLGDLFFLTRNVITDVGIRLSYMVSKQLFPTPLSIMHTEKHTHTHTHTHIILYSIYYRENVVFRNQVDGFIDKCGIMVNVFSCML